MTDTYRSPAPVFPTSSKIIPYGRGLWTAFESAVTAGGKTEDLNNSIDICRRMGVSWIAPRAGAGGAPDASFDEASMRAYLDAGLHVYPWVFPYKGTEQAVVRTFKRHFLGGAHGCIINAEFEYQSATAADARNLVRLIREAWNEAQGENVRMNRAVVADEAFIGHAPPDYLGAGVGHPLSDELVALDEICDAIMPQVYAFEHDDRGHAYHLARVAAGYQKRGYEVQGVDSKIYWIGCTYRPKTRGGQPTKPMIIEEALVVAGEVLAFLEHELVRHNRAHSLYSLDAMKWINGAKDRVVDMVEEWDKKALTVEQTPTPRTMPMWEENEGEKTP